ncbi:MAG: hypothetical protein WEC36_15790 [Phycisphaeraceae bacterium]
MTRQPKGHDQAHAMHALTQGAAACLLGISARSLREAIDAPRNADGGYDGPTIVEWWSKCGGQRPANFTDDEAELLALVADDVYAGIGETGAATMARRLGELHDRHGPALLHALGEVVLRQVRAVAKAAEQFPLDAEAQREAQAQAARDDEAAAALRIAVVCERCGRLRRGKRWIKAPVPSGYIRIGGGCPDCDAK